ncbi:conserved hypothetical protein [Hyella patelloides LEGE 07179]|uniref:HTH cro/C1-type domain-containing protein n=1 Tax=Hyella patelloides LEGE 07179 TaxID=945734 RepID=A0A563W2E9_9CYAN|nr:helix-turn-helix domain-containing protein [Hyella patelloides]VEP17884.1 conserved hypothetical protein [Hyella patelloides LEGE 07179]
MVKTLIRWNLIDVMETHKINAGDLAQKMNVSKNAISNLRSTKMPRLTEERLNQLLLCLNCLRRKDSPVIEPKDLIGFSLTPEELDFIQAGVMI